MNKRIKKKHTICGKVYLTAYHRNCDESLPFEWFVMCHRIRSALGHKIGKRRSSLERYFRRKYFWSEKQRKALTPSIQIHLDVQAFIDSPLDAATEAVQTVVNDIETLKEKYEDAIILDMLNEELF